MSLGPVIPVLRIFDEDRMRDFNLGFLGFSLDWAHRFEPGLPLYAQVSRAGAVLHLSAHHGDGTPGTVVRILARGLDALREELLARRYPYASPGIEARPWGRELAVTDPFGNRLVFHETEG